MQRLATLAIEDADIQRWADSAMVGLSGEVTVRVVDVAESRDLNHRYRNKNQPTNVLSFLSDPLPVDLEGELPPLGDIVLCAPVVCGEAEAQGKAIEAHCAHLVIHGCLHLRGFDHEATAEADVMEAEERKLMASLGFADPYAAA